MKTYEVTVSRDERWWMVAVPELGGVTQARRLDEVERMAREYIAVSTDVPLSTDTLPGPVFAITVASPSARTSAVWVSQSSVLPGGSVSLTSSGLSSCTR